MNKHTKGPWDLQKPMFGEQHIYVYSENSVDGKAGSGRQHICVLPYEGKKGGAAYHEMFNANARLIAAAPELLEALKYCRNKIAYMQAHGEWYSPGRAIEMADAAIAKAEVKHESNAEIIALKKQQIDLLVTMNQIKSATPDGGYINTLARKAISAAGDSQNNRRLLELAATAAGWMPNNSWAWCANTGKNGAFCYRLNGEMIVWNPLDDNADAFSLAVKLRIEITYNEEHKCVCRFWTNTKGFMAVAEQIGDDPCAATRRTIVRAAAKIATEKAKAMAAKAVGDES